MPPHMAVWRSVRAHGDVKTRKSRRTLRLPLAAVETLKALKVRQAEERLAARSDWEDRGLVFTSKLGTPLDASHVRAHSRAFARTLASVTTGHRVSSGTPSFRS